MTQDSTFPSSRLALRRPDRSYLVPGAPLSNWLTTLAPDSAQTAMAGDIASQEKGDSLTVTTADVKPASDLGSSQGIEATLKERGARYGSFVDHAFIAQQIKDVMRVTTNWEKLAHDQKEALEMIAHKIARILNGDPDYHDSWHDIVGYTKLVADRLLGIK